MSAQPNDVVDDGEGLLTGNFIDTDEIEAENVLTEYDKRITLKQMEIEHARMKLERAKLDFEHDKIKLIDRLVASDKLTGDALQHILTSWFK